MIAPTLTGKAGDKQNTLSWNLVPGAVETHIRRSAGGAAFAQFYNGTDLSIVDTAGLVNGASYRYKARGFDKSGKSGPWSAEVTLVPKAAPVAPTVVGYGDAVTGGDARKATPMIVRSWADLKAALAIPIPRFIQGAGGWLDGGGEKLVITSGDFTLTEVNIKRGWLLINGPIRNFKITESRIRPGDEVADPGDADSISLNAKDGDVDGFVISHCSLMWGPDIGGFSLLGQLSGGLVKNGTVQFTIAGPGLNLSAHPEGTAALGGHAKSGNISTQPSGTTGKMTDMAAIPPGSDRITFYCTLFTGGEERVPQAHYANNLDYVNIISYNWSSHGIEGNPRGLNIIGSIAKSGPRTKSGSQFFFDHTPKPAHKPYPDSIFIEHPHTIGFVYKDNIPAIARRSTALNGGAYHVTEMDPSLPDVVLLDAILAKVGPSVRDIVDQAVVDSVHNGTDNWLNGVGLPAPNPYWP